MEATIVYRGSIVIREKKMEATIRNSKRMQKHRVVWEGLGFR